MISLGRAPSDQRDSLRRVVRRNFAETVLSSLETLGRTVALAIESVRGAIADLVARRFHWAETLRQA